MTLSRRLEAVVLAFLSRNHEIGRGEGLLLAFSGGADSTALLRLVHATQARHARPIAAAHVNHAVRPDADAEEKRAREICARLAVPFFSARLAPPPTPRPPSEAALRRARMRALRDLSTRAGCPWILLGHTLDDQAETVLLNLIRGAGLGGLAGIAPIRRPFLRPLMTIEKAVLREYLRGLGQEWVEDPTNLDPSRTRNRIRHNLLPLLEGEIRSGSTRAITRAATHVRHASEALDAAVDEHLGRLDLRASAGSRRLDPRPLRALPRGMIEHLLLRLARSLSNENTEILAEHLAKLTEAIQAGKPGSYQISTRSAAPLAARLSGGLLEMTAGLPAGDDGRTGGTTFEPVALGWQARVPWGGGLCRARLIEEGRRPGRIRVRGLERLQIFDADMISPPVRIRAPGPGDCMETKESGRVRKVPALLSERGVLPELRATQPVIEDAGGILWLPGIRRAARARVDATTRRIWIVGWSGRLPVSEGIEGGSLQASGRGEGG